jgi:hypothetical protein
MIMPKFIGMGAPRCGTRWLAQCLSEHPQIALPPHEVYFFTTRRVVHSFYSKGVQWYSGLFEKCVKPGVTTWGEITPVYLLDDDTPCLMHKHVPDAKLICCLRDQSERAYSWYRFFLKIHPDIFNTNYSFKTFLTYHTEVYGREGFYLDHLQRYLALYPRESILILLYDDLETDPWSYIQRVFCFLEVDSLFIPPSLNKRINPVNLEFPRSKTLKVVSSRLSGYLQLKKIGELIDRFNTVQVPLSEFPDRHKIDLEMRGKIAELYRAHNKKLGEFLGRDLSHWNCGRKNTGTSA